MSVQFMVEPQQIVTKMEKERERSKEEREKEGGKERRKGERERREKDNREQRTFIHKGIKVTITTKIQSLLSIKTYKQKETSWWRSRWLCSPSYSWMHQKHTFRYRSHRTPAEYWRESLTTEKEYMLLLLLLLLLCRFSRVRLCATP